ncbi:MAG: BatA domain-containing protein [Fuerstiella sp.]|nr:BatA domain-containing protein [Fuerstiella sp.]
MALINASLLAGVILAGLPVLLHLIMRAKPKRIEFPALQLLKTRQTSNSRRMKLRQILLLLLRAILIVVAVLAVTRPSLPAARYGLRWHEWLILAVVVGATCGIYTWMSRRAKAGESAEHLLRERRGRLRAFSLLGGIAAALICVGVPWGLRVQGELTGPRNPLAADIPVAAVFVFDNSLSMTYQYESQTRLEQASRIATSHLTDLPQGSRIAVVTTAPESDVVFQADLAGARSRLSDFDLTTVPRSLNSVVRDAIEGHVLDREQVQDDLDGGDAFSREIYLFTDFSEVAWRSPDESGLRDLLVQHDWLQVYLVDVGVKNPINVSLSQLRLDRQATVEGQPVSVSVTVVPTPAADPEVTLELYTLDQLGNEIAGGGGGRSARRTVRFEGSPPVAVFNVSGIKGRDVQRGFVRLTSPDPLTFDDIRYFTFGVTALPRILLVSDRLIDSKYLLNAMQPLFLERQGIRKFDCKAITTAQLSREKPGNYDVICIVNLQRPDPSVWIDLYRFVNDGGSLFVSTGGEKLIQATDWRTAEAEKLLPGLPVSKLPFRRDPGRLTLVADDNPIVRSFSADPDAKTALSYALFDICWTFELPNDSRVLMRFSDKTGRPALIERRVGSGRTLLFASAVDNLENGGAQWNEGFVVDNWAFLMLVDEVMQYLTGAADEQRNFVVGDPVEIPVPAAKRFSRYAVARPRLRLTEGTLPFDEPSVLLKDVNEAGHFQLRSIDDGNNFDRDFAVNDLDEESNLTTITDESLDAVFGADRYSRVTDPEQLDRAVNVGRLGVEIFPILMGLLIAIFCGEHLMANFFYDEEPVPNESGSSTKGSSTG